MSNTQESFRVLNYVSLSVMTLMVYDWALSFGDEVEFIWSAAWSTPKVLYIVSRFYPVIYLTVLYFVRNLAETSFKHFLYSQKMLYFLHVAMLRCSNYTWYHGFGGVICILPPVTAVFTMRVSALYHDSRKVVYFVWLLWLETMGELITTIRVTIGEHQNKTIIYGPGCFTVTGSDLSLYRSELGAWAPALFGSLSLFILTLYRLGYLFPRYIFQFKRKPLAMTSQNFRVLLAFITDGTIYFFFIFAATLLTMVSDLFPKLTFFNDWWNPWFILLYSLSGSRLVLNLRRNAFLDCDITTRHDTTPVGHMEFWDPTLSATGTASIIETNRYEHPV